jgi:putative ABC transport system permease protein
MWLDRVLQDVRYGWRTLTRNPGFALVAILTAAVGIAANTSIFSAVYAVLLHPLPYPDAGRLVAPANIAKDGPSGLGVADFQYAAWRDQAGIFDGIAAYTNRRFTLTGGGEAEDLNVDLVTPGFLRALGVTPLIGRDFAAGDAALRGGTVALMSHGLWTRRFGADPSILAKQILLNGKPYSVAGVLPRTFESLGSREAGLLLAMSEPPAQPGNGVYFYNVIARLKRGIRAERAQADLALINQRLESTYVRRLGRGRADTRVIGLHEKLVGNVQPALIALAGAVGLVLLIVCVNISNLLLARAVARQKEIAVRIALGAGRGRIVRQLLTEGMLLASAGGLAGLALAIGGVRLVRAIAPAGVPHIQDAGIGWAVFAFNFVLALGSGILFGLAPLRLASGVDPEAALKQAGRSASGSRNDRRVENLLIVSETAFALILLAGAGLLMRTFAALTAIAPGFRPDNVLTARVSLPYWKFSTAERRTAALDGLLESLRSGPGVDAAGRVGSLPYAGFVMTGALDIEGRPAPPDRKPDADNVAVDYVGGDYFRALGIPILDGRAIDSSDRAGRPAVAIANEAFARRFFPGARVIGARVRVSGVTEWMEIVGLARSVKQVGLASEPRPELWLAAPQSESGGSALTVAIHSAGNAEALIPWLRSRIAAVDKDIPPPEIETMRARMATLVASQVFVMRLLALFAAIAIALAAVGIYSVLVCSVERRAREIGIRLALGAKQADIMGLIVGRGLRLSLAGAALGVGGAMGLTRYLESLLYGVTPHDPVTLAAGCGLLIAVAISAAWIPARRALREDAAATLRAE